MRKGLVIFCAIVLLGLMSFAQENTGGILGKVTLNDGSPLPGAGVTLTGNVFGKATAVTSTEGNFRFLRLSPGNYELTFELQGFKTIIRSNIRVSVNATAQVDMVMEQGAIEEKVTVTAAVPIIDARRVVVSRNVTSETLQALPVSRSMVEIINLAPGILPPKPVVGGFSFGSWFAGYGTTGFKSEIAMDGAFYGSTFYPGEPPGNSWSVNSERIEETKVTTTGMDIHSVTGGVNVNFVSKRGGNALSGTFYLNVIDKSFVSRKKAPAAYAGQGLFKDAAGVIGDWKYGVSLGGALLRDHLWYFISYGLVDAYSQNMYTLKTSRPLNYDIYAKSNFQVLGNITGEFSYQKGMYEGRNTLFNHAKEAWGIDTTRPTELYAGQLNASFGSRLLVSAKFTYLNMFQKQITPGTDQYYTGTEPTGDYNPPGRFYIYNSFYSPTMNVDAAGCWPYRNNQQKRPYVVAEANYFAEKLLGADHEVLVGVDIDKPKYVEGYWLPNQMFVYITPNANSWNGKYESYLRTYANTIGPRTSSRYGIFFQDIITLKRLAVSIGLRFDRQRWEWDPVTLNGIAPQGQPIPAWDQWLGTFKVSEGRTPYISTFSPRISATYDLSGGRGRDLIKASFADYAGALNNYVGFRTGFKAGYLRGEFTLPFWDKNGNYLPDAGEYETDGITPDEIDRRKALGIAEAAAWAKAHPGVTAPWNYFTYPQYQNYNFTGNRLGKQGSAKEATDFLGDDFSSERIREIVLGYERKLNEDMGVSLIGSYKKEYNGIWARGYTGTPSSYTLIPIQNTVVIGTDPVSGWDIYGTAPGTVIPTAAGYVVSNYKKVYDDFLGLQVIFKKQLVHKWMLDASLSLTRWIRHRSLDEMARDTLWDYYDKGLFSSANYESQYIMANSTWSLKISGVYQLPWGVNLAASIDGRQGFPYNVWVSRYLNTTLPKKGTKYGDERMPDVWSVNAKANKIFNLFNRGRLDVFIIGYNMLDAQTALLYNYTEVPTTNKPTSIMIERIFELGVRFSF